MNRYDVVVVGGRVAGASTALLLARGGAKVALLDRAGYGSDTMSTHALMRGGVLQLARWGLLDRITSAGTPAVRRTVFHYADAPEISIDIAPRYGVDALYAPRRTLLDRVLVDAAAAAGVHVHHGTRVDEVRRQGGRVFGVRAVRPNGTEMVLDAALTVGADGLRSLVADQVGARERHVWLHRTSSLYRYVTELPAAGYEWAYGPGAAAGLIPTDQGATCVFVTASRATMRSLRPRGVDGAMRALLERAAPGLVDRVVSANPLPGRVWGWAGHHGFVREAAGPGWALVGDAAYFKDPLTAHGITDALRDAELLADAVLSQAPGVGLQQALRRYQLTRDRLAHQLAAVTDRIAALDWDTPQLQGLLRELAASMVEEVDHLAARPARTPVTVG